MGIEIFRDLEQGSDAWLNARLGLLTASEIGLIVTPKLKIAANDKVRSHTYDLLAQRINGWADKTFVSFHMARGWEDEAMARYIYHEKVAPIDEVGFVTNDEWGFTLGYSPDGLVGDDGLIECKSRMPKYQAEVIINGVVPEEHIIQVQAGMLISGRKWCDYLSYSAGMPMAVIREYPDEQVQSAIIEAAAAFEKNLSEKMGEYEKSVARMKRDGLFFETERRIEQEITAS